MQEFLLEAVWPKLGITIVGGIGYFLLNWRSATCIKDAGKPQVLCYSGVGKGTGLVLIPLVYLLWAHGARIEPEDVFILPYAYGASFLFLATLIYFLYRSQLVVDHIGIYSCRNGKRVRTIPWPMVIEQRYDRNTSYWILKTLEREELRLPAELPELENCMYELAQRLGTEPEDFAQE